ncbi:MAG: 2-hydroxyacyl-CoA dehydratase [Deltaproteobacteria bacterium]|nr:2-hydroxyacyl-CoA dehydratase [Deltaproteobacteria bacterium]MBW2121583.1 2-hydroxyacyl-CoA dehydratase [Deltaproteobacteria bacterium]
MIERFREWYENRHEYARSYKERTGRKVVGFFCTYSPEEIFYAFDVLPVRILGSHEVQDVTEPHLFGMFCPFCRDVLAQGLKGRYEYLDGISIGQSCLHLRQAYTSWDIHRNPGWSHYLPMPSHVQSKRAVSFLVGEYRLLIERLEELTGRRIDDDDLRRGIDIMNRVRRVMKEIYELRKDDNPPITGEEAMYMTCAQFFTDAREFLPVAEEVKRELTTRKLDRDPGKRIMLVGSENDDVEYIRMIETLGERESVGCTVVIEEHCTTTRYFWDEVELGDRDPLTAIAERYVLRTPCPSKDWPVRTRLDRILRFAKDWRADGAIVLQQKFCDPHEADIPFVRKHLQDNGIPTYFLEFDVTVPAGPFAIRTEAFLETLEAEADLF